MEASVRRSLAFVATILLLWVFVGDVARAQDDGADAGRKPSAPWQERVLRLPGDSERPVMLQATLLMPEGTGPFPLAVMNHGASGDGHPERMPRYRLTFSAYYFLSRGYAVLMPMMRGYAASEGSVPHPGCKLAAVGLLDAKDIRAVLDAVVREPQIDASRIVIAGQSFGGWNTLAFGTLDYPHVKGLVNFNGGMTTSVCTTSQQSLVADVAGFGAHTKVPSIWFYGDNDSIFPVATWRAMYDRYTHAGGRAELVGFGTHFADSHKLLDYPEGLPIWTPRVDAFLLSVGLPGTPLLPQYLPKPFPPPSHFAAVDDVAAVPYLNDQGRALYRKFLALPFPRAFAVSPTGSASSQQGGFDPMQRALDTCPNTGRVCQVYAIDDNVVWTKPAAEPAPAVRMVSKTLAPGTTVTLVVSVEVNDDCSARGLPRLAVTEPPAHGTAVVAQRDAFPNFPPNSPRAACNTKKVAAAALDYTPAPGFVGTDGLVVQRTTLNNANSSYRFTLIVQ
jgi:dienelactone hydrolase